MLTIRTTIRIDDELYRSVKERAAREGRTIGEIIEDALRAQSGRVVTDAAIEPLPTYGGSGAGPGVDLADNAALRDLLDADVPPDALR